MLRLDAIFLPYGPIMMLLGYAILCGNIDG